LAGGDFVGGGMGSYLEVSSGKEYKKRVVG